MNDMIYIEKKSVVSIPEVNGAVSDTWNINDKTTNAPSIRLVEELIPSVIIENNIYSTEETIIGFRINSDGSKQPVYRKFIDKSITGGSNRTIATIENMKDLIRYDGSVFKGTYPTSGNHENIYSMWTVVSRNKCNFVVETINTGRLVLTLEYTKTTD